MKAKGPRDERETIINFNDAEDTADVWTASQTQYRKLLKLGYRPIEDHDRSANFKVPKKCVSVRKLRKLTSKQRGALKEHVFCSGDTRLSRGTEA